MNKRIRHFDLLKGIAIFLMVMGHVLTMCIRGLDAAFCFKVIGQVHMPIFFFISGYFTYKTVASDNTFVSPNLKKRFIQLIVPFLCITPLWVWYFPHSHLQSPLSDNLPDLYRAYWKDGYWFTLCLFELCLIYAASAPILRRLRHTWMHVIFFAITYGVLIFLACLVSDEGANVDYSSIGLTARFYPVFIMGVMARKHSDRFNAMWHNSAWLTACIVTFVMPFYCIVYPWDMPWSSNSAVITSLRYILTPIMHFSLIIIVLAAVEPWSKREFDNDNHSPSVVARYFNLLGNESLGIYLLHYFFLFPLTVLQEPMRQMGLANAPMLTVAVIVAFVVIALTLATIYLIKLSPLFSFLLLGKSRSK